MKATSDQYREAKRQERQRDDQEVLFYHFLSVSSNFSQLQRVIEYQRRQQLAQEEKARAERTKAQEYDEDNKRVCFSLCLLKESSFYSSVSFNECYLQLYKEQLEKRRSERPINQQGPIVEDSFFDKFGRNPR